MTEPRNGYVKWQIFGWAMGIILVVVGWVFYQTTSASNKAQEAKDGVSSLQADVKVIQNDVSWIRATLERQIPRTSSKVQDVP